jgi:hypothetical protein
VIKVVFDNPDPEIKCQIEIPIVNLPKKAPEEEDINFDELTVDASRYPMREDETPSFDPVNIGDQSADRTLI